MLHPNIEKRFKKTLKPASVMNDDTKWFEVTTDKEMFSSPYYQNIEAPVTELLEVQKYLFNFKLNPLLLSDSELAASLTSNGLIEIFLPMISVFPGRITPQLIDTLKSSAQVIIHFSINHPGECTYELMQSCSLLADQGFILNNHMTLLKGINDSAEVVKELNLKLLMMRVRPYSISIYEQRKNESRFFDITAEAGVDILESLRGWTSGLAVPHVLVQKEDLSFEAVLPNYIKKNEGESFVFRNYKNMDYEYFNS